MLTNLRNTNLKQWSSFVTALKRNWLKNYNELILTPISALAKMESCIFKTLRFWTLWCTASHSCRFGNDVNIFFKLFQGLLLKQRIIFFMIVVHQRETTEYWCSVKSYMYIRKDLSMPPLIRNYSWTASSKILLICTKKGRYAFLKLFSFRRQWFHTTQNQLMLSQQCQVTGSPNLGVQNRQNYK